MPTPFQQWVAKAIAECGGNPAIYLYGSCGFPSKEGLTSSATRMQHLSSFFFTDYFSDMAREYAVVTTDLKVLH